MRFALAILLALLATSRVEAGRGAALIKYLPDDTSVVIASDVARVRGSAIFKKGFQLARDKNTTLDAIATALPVDKLADTIVIGMNPAQHAVVVLDGRVDKLLGEAKKNTTKSESHEGVTYWTTSDGEVALIDKKLVFTTPGDMPGVIDRAKDKKAKGPSAVRMLLAATLPTSGVFGGIVFDASQRSDLDKQLGAEPQWTTFSLVLSAKLAIDGRLHFASEADAAAATKTINGLLTAADARGKLEGFVGKEFSDSIAIEQQQAFARCRATLTAEEVDKVMSLLKMFM